MSTITVVGIGAGGWPELGAVARSALLAAAQIIGSRRQLELLPDAVTGRRIAWPSPLAPAIERLCANPEAGTCVLASGDPMLHGIGATLARRLGAERVRVHPAPSAFAIACARLGWDQAEVTLCSTVAAPLCTLARHLQPGRRLIVYASGAKGAREIAELLRKHALEQSKVTLLAALGAETERVEKTTVAALSSGTVEEELYCLALELCGAGGSPARALALPDEAYAHDGQLTKRPVRALTVAGLAPLPGQLLWDVGAGAGSVGIEWLRAEPLARAVAIERSPERAQRIAANAHELGVPQLEVLAASAPEVLGELPQPQAIFIGGGLTRAGMLECCLEALVPGGRLIANATTLEAQQILVAARALRRQPIADRALRGGSARRLHRDEATVGARAVELCRERSMIHFIGAGPGAADLLTVRASRLLMRCPVWIYAGSLLSPELFALAPAQARMIDSQALKLEEIVAAMQEAHDRGVDVARLHSGDLSIYSALGEQTRALDALGIPWRMVPGVPAFAAAAAALGRELTLPGVAQSVILARYGSRSTPLPAAQDLAALAAHRTTLVVHLGAHALEQVVSELLPAYGERAAAGVVASASWPSEVVVCAPLGEIAQRAQAAGIHRNGLLIVGEALLRAGFRESHLYSATRRRALREESADA